MRYFSHSVFYLFQENVFHFRQIRNCHWQATVETLYNAVLGVHRSDLRYIPVDGYNAVVPPMACIRCRSSHIMNIFTIWATILCEYTGINIFCVPILTSIKSCLFFSGTETYYQIRQAVILFVNDTAEYCYVIDWKRTSEYTGRSFLDEFEFQWSLWSERQSLPNLSLFSYLISRFISLNFRLYPRMQWAFIFCT